MLPLPGVIVWGVVFPACWAGLRYVGLAGRMQLEGGVPLRAAGRVGGGSVLHHDLNDMTSAAQALDDSTPSGLRVLA